MKILIICSKRFYDNIPNIKKELIKNDIEVFLPNCYDDPATEERMWHLGKDKHQEFKAKMYKQSEDTIKNMDAVLVLNFDKNTEGKIEKNYISSILKLIFIFYLLKCNAYIEHRSSEPIYSFFIIFAD